MEKNFIRHTYWWVTNVCYTSPDTSSTTNTIFKWKPVLGIEHTKVAMTI